MKVLFIGGTGIISSACSKRALEKGIDLYHLNRGKTQSLRPVEHVKQIIADVRDLKKAGEALEGYQFDTVVDWITFVPEHLRSNLKLFKDKTKQFIFISSASAYQTPPLKMPVTEDTPLYNPFWQYSRDKAECEQILKAEAASFGFDYTIVRPSHTYDKTVIPITGNFTALHRILNDKPVIVPGDGTSIWTLTHHSDFAKGFVGLLGNPMAMNETFHITSEEWITWNRITELLAEAAGKKAKIISIPSNVVATYDKEMGDGLLGDKMHSMIFDNSKIKRAVPEFNCEISFETGAREIVQWHLENQDKLKIDPELDRLFDEMISKVLKMDKN